MKKIVLILFAALVFESNSFAVELTINECIQTALERNSGLKISGMDVLATGEEAEIAYKGFFPTLRFKGNYLLQDKTGVFVYQPNVIAPGIPPEKVEIPLDNQNYYNLRLILEQPLFTGGQLTHTYRRSKITNEGAMHVSERQKKLLIFEVKRAFFDALKEQSNRRILEKTVAAKRERLRLVQELNAEGYAQKEDVLSVEADLADTEFELFKTSNRAGLAQSRLKSVMYYQGDDEISLINKPVNVVLTASLQEIKETASRNREDLKASQSKVLASEEETDIARSGYYPKASVEGGYILQKETAYTRPEVWALMAQLDWPLFEWNKTKAEVRRREALAQRQRYEHDELVRTVILDAEEAWRLVKEKEKEVETKEKKLKTVEFRLRKAMDRYAERSIKLADLLETETEMIKAYNEYQIALVNLNISLAHIETTTSQFSETWLSEREIYSSDIESLTRDMQELITKKSNTLSSSNSYQPTPVSAQDRENRVNQLSASLPLPAPQSSTPVVVQVASVKSKNAAEKVGLDLGRKLNHKVVKIVKQGGFYKTRITGFSNRQEARDQLDALGVKDYFFVTSSHEY